MRLTKEIRDKLTLLKTSPNENIIDHIMVLYELSFLYSERKATILKPIMDFYFENSLDNLPALKEKHLWNEEKYKNLLKSFNESHQELVKIIDNIL